MIERLRQIWTDALPLFWQAPLWKWAVLVCVLLLAVIALHLFQRLLRIGSKQWYVTVGLLALAALLAENRQLFTFFLVIFIMASVGNIVLFGIVYLNELLFPLVALYFISFNYQSIYVLLPWGALLLLKERLWFVPFLHLLRLCLLAYLYLPLISVHQIRYDHQFFQGWQFSQQLKMLQ